MILGPGIGDISKKVHLAHGMKVEVKDYTTV
jgi:hypothetical protein